MTASALRNIALNINDIDAEEIDTVYRLCKARMSYLNSILSTKFDVGQKVHFDAGMRGIVHGEIVKVNNKTAKVKANASGMNWNVSLGLLHAA